MLRRPLRLLPVLLLLACSNDESGGFISLDNLCIGYAETACAAQQHCCDGDQDLVACETRVLKACEPVRYELTSQTSLRFDLFREAAKWIPFLAIAIWLSIAQVRAWRKLATHEAGTP